MSQVISESERQLSGIDKSSRIIKMKNVQGNPQPSSYLTKRGQELFVELKDHIMSTLNVYDADGILLSMAAHSLYIYERYAKEVEDIGYIQTFEKGARNISPEFSVMERAQDRANKYFELLGIGLKARQALLSFRDRGGMEIDPVEELKKKRAANDL